MRERLSRFIDKSCSQYAAATLTVPFTRFNLSLALAALAGETFRLCFAWRMLSQTNDVATFGIAMAIMSSCQIVCRLCIGWVGDRYGPLRVVMATFFIQSFIAGTLSIMMIGGHYSSTVVICLLGAFGACMGGYSPHF